MSPTCERCGSWIEVDNRRFPGYCSPYCRDQAHGIERPQPARAWDEHIAAAVRYLKAEGIARDHGVPEVTELVQAAFPALPFSVARAAALRHAGLTRLPRVALVTQEEAMKAAGIPSGAVDVRALLDLPLNRRGDADQPRRTA